MDLDAGIYLNFTQDCPNCGPATVRYENGTRLDGPCCCGYEPPALRVGCEPPAEESITDA